MNCLDSSFIVDFLDPDTDHHEVAVEWMETRSGEVHATPSICAFEVLRGSARAGDERFDHAVGFLQTLTVWGSRPVASHPLVALRRVAGR